MGGPLSRLPCVCGFESSSLSIPLLGCTDHERHVAIYSPPPHLQVRVPTHIRRRRRQRRCFFHRATRVETPTHDQLLSQTSARRAPACCFRQSPEPAVVFSFHRSHRWIPGDRTVACLRLLPCHGPPANRAYFGSRAATRRDADHWLPAPRRLGPVFFSIQVGRRIYSSVRARSPRPYFLF